MKKEIPTSTSEKFKGIPLFAYSNINIARLVEYLAKSDVLKGISVRFEGSDMIPASQVLQETAHRISRAKDDDVFVKEDGDAEKEVGDEKEGK